MLGAWGLDIDVAFAPERMAEHNAVEELVSHPQIGSLIAMTIPQLESQLTCR
jgi:hypothetical protein